MDKCNTVDTVCCMQHLQICFESEERARILLHNVSSLLKPGGYFFGITPDSSMIWAKYQKMVEAYHNRSGGMKPNAVPNCIRSESYMITFDVEEEKFPIIWKEIPAQFDLRLAREAGLEYVEIQNLTEFYDDNRAQFGSLILKFGPNLVILVGGFFLDRLYTTFIFRRPDPDMVPPITTPVLHDGPHVYDEVRFVLHKERNLRMLSAGINGSVGLIGRVSNQIISCLRDWQGATWWDNDLNGTTEPPPGLGKISDQKGILGPGPADLRFPEAL
ncbi:mRNA cap guanine-N7 methyltransferase 2 [Bienertia sinuspersici]